MAPLNRRKNSLRLKGYDYSQPGAYFVTIMTYGQQQIFGEISNGIMQFSELGEIVRHCWLRIPKHYPNTTLDEFVIMPNHVHGIIHVGAEDFPPLRGKPKRPLGNIIRGFKIGVTKWARKYTTINNVWQRSFYDHIVRNDAELERIQTYIRNNPLKWHLDWQNRNCVQEEPAEYISEDWMI